jgi:3-oxoadipate enol-lactonase
LPRAEINGAELNYELTGNGPAVVLVHEGICDLRMWDELVEALATEFTVLRYDLRGYGGSTLPPGPFSHNRDLLALLDHVGIERAALVGVSYGGRIALDTAFVAPDRITGLVLAAPALRDHEWSRRVREFGDEEERLLDAGDVDAATELNVRLWVDGPNRTRDAVAEDVRERVREMQRRAFEIQLAAYSDEPPPGPEEPVNVRLADIEAPTLVIVGDADVPDFLEITDRLGTELPNSQTVVLENTAHTIPLERPGVFRDLVLDFLRERAG